MDYILLRIILYIFLSVLVAYYWEKKGRNFWHGFLISIIISPIIGFIIGFILTVPTGKHPEIDKAKKDIELIFKYIKRYFQ